jgi:glycosyltransferase involved in cell wall biosynthesis
MKHESADNASVLWENVWIAIPAFEEERTIRSLAEAALALCPRVIVVDDGSNDRTQAQLEGLPVTVLVHETNQGKAASLRTAFAFALRHDAGCVITFDGDGQHDPADAPYLLGAWQRQPTSIVIGSRLHDRSQFPPARYRANRFACFWISWAAGHPIADSQSGFRIYPVQVMQLALSGKVRGNRFTFESEILIEAAAQGLHTLAVAIPGRYPVQARASHFRPVIDIAKIVIMVAARLLARGMAPLELRRSLRQPVVLPGRRGGAGMIERPEPVPNAAKAPVQ